MRTTEEIAGSTYERFKICVPRPKCDDTTIVLIFTPNGAQAWAAFREKGIFSFLGNPSEAQQVGLEGQFYVPEPPPKTRSSALGLGQFVNRTWLELIKRVEP